MVFLRKLQANYLLNTIVFFSWCDISFIFLLFLATFSYFFSIINAWPIFLIKSFIQRLTNAQSAHFFSIIKHHSLNSSLVCLGVKVNNFYFYPFIFGILENRTKGLLVFESLEKFLAFRISERLDIEIRKIRIDSKTNFIVTLRFILPFEVLLDKFLLISKLPLFFKLEFLTK